MLFTDTVAVTATRRTADGYLVADARVARAGVQAYTGKEAGKPDVAVVRMLRPAEEVFDKDSLATFAHKPVTNGHPAKPVTAANYRQVAVGHVADQVARDGEFVRVPLMVADAAAIADVDAGRAELSAGYACDVDWTPGETDAGEAYDAVQRRIRINHVALVDRGRAGPQCRLGDCWTAFDAGEARAPGRSDSARSALSDHEDHVPMSLKTHLVDGHTVEMSDAAIVAVSALQRRAGELTADNLKLVADAASAATAHRTALEAKDGEIAGLTATHRTALEAKDGEIAALKAQIPDAAKLDALAAGRVELITRAKGVLGDGFVATGKSDAEIRKAVVAKALGETASTMSDAAIEGAFAVVAAGRAPVDPIRGALGTLRVGDAGDPKRVAFQEMCDGLTDAWKGSPATA